jgi:hypothetical protein
VRAAVVGDGGEHGRPLDAGDGEGGVGREEELLRRSRRKVARWSFIHRMERVAEGEGVGSVRGCAGARREGARVRLSGTERTEERSPPLLAHIFPGGEGSAPGKAQQLALCQLGSPRLSRSSRYAPGLGNPRLPLLSRIRGRGCLRLCGVEQLAFSAVRSKPVVPLCRRL